MRKIWFWAIMILILILYVGLSFFGASFIKLTPSQDQVSDLQSRVDILRSLTEAIAIVIAGLWTYEVYIKNRYDHPYPKIEHRVEHCILENGFIYLSVFVTVTNQGKTKLDLGGGSVVIRQVSPWSKELNELIENALANSKDEDIRLGHVPGLFIDDGQRVGWMTLGSRQWNELRGGLKELEPGQIREIQFGFLLESDVKVAEIISYFKYAESNWESATLYSLDIQNGSPPDEL